MSSAPLQPPSESPSPYVSPKRDSEHAAARRSRAGRQTKPKRSLMMAMETPLLKWEKEQQRQRGKKGCSKDISGREGGVATAATAKERPRQQQVKLSRRASDESVASSIGLRDTLYETDADEMLISGLGPLASFRMSEEYMRSLCKGNDGMEGMPCSSKRRKA